MIYDEDTPVISLTKPILINKNSNSKIISEYLNSKIFEACISYYLDESILEFNTNNMGNKLDGPGVLVNYSKINLF